MIYMDIFRIPIAKNYLLRSFEKLVDIPKSLTSRFHISPQTKRNSSFGRNIYNGRADFKTTLLSLSLSLFLYIIEYSITPVPCPTSYQRNRKLNYYYERESSPENHRIDSFMHSKREKSSFSKNSKNSKNKFLKSFSMSSSLYVILYRECI